MACVRAGVRIREEETGLQADAISGPRVPARGPYVLSRAKFPGHLEAKQAFKCQFHIRKEGRKS